MSDKKIKVAQIIGKAGNGGVEAYIFNYFKTIDKNKFGFDFFVCGDSKIIDRDFVEQNGCKIFDMPEITSIFSYLRFLRTHFKNDQYDIVQANLNTLSFIPLYAAKKEGVKIRIANSLSTSSKKDGLRNFIKKILKLFAKAFATNYFACSNFAGKWMFGNDIVGKNNYFLVRNAIPLNNYKFDNSKRNEIRKRLNLGDEFVVGTVGRLEKQKNQIFLINIFYELKQKHSNAKLIIIGEGSLKNELIKTIKTFNLEKDVLILDSSVTGVGKEMANFYNVFDVFVLPSLYEGLPTVGLEAQANGLPCFFSDNITKETTITDKVHFKSLTSGSLSWAEDMLEYLDFKNRNLIIKNSDFDITHASIVLENIYINLVEEIK